MKPLVFVLAGVGVGAVVVLLIARISGPAGTEERAAAEGARANVELLRLQVDGLRDALAEESAARRALSDDVEQLRDALMEAYGVDDEVADEGVEGLAHSEPSERASRASRASGVLRPSEVRGPSSPAGAVGASRPRPAFNLAGLLRTGLPEVEAERVREVWEAHELEKLELQDLATREGWAGTRKHRQQLKQIERSARDELGDHGYDSMRYGAGRTNRVRVRDVLDGSAAARAGIEPGDIVVRYNDRRVWESSDLKTATSRGERGADVRVEVLREGEPMFFSLERGPIGIFMVDVKVPPPAG